MEAEPLSNIKDIDGNKFVWKNIVTRFGASILIFLLGLKACRLRFTSYFNIFVGSQSVSIEVRIIWYLRAQVLKLVLLPFYLLFPVIILSCSFCVLYFSFLFCDVH